MRLDDLLQVSIRQVFRQKWRNLGVVFAIALGTAGLIVIITMGRCVGLGLVFAVILGIGAGISSAIRASRMEIVSAVRYESSCI